MAGKKSGKVILAVVLSFAIAFAPGILSMPVQASTSLAQLQNKQSDLKKQQQENASKLKMLKADKTQKLAYKDTLVTQINNVESQIDVYNAQVAVLNANVKAKETEIAAKQVSINDNFDRLKQRVRALYLMGEASNLEIILNAKNITDFADKAEMLRAISVHDTQLINTLKTDMKAIQTQKAEIEANRTQIASAKKDLDAKNSELNSLVAQTAAAVADISANVSAASAQQSALTKQMDASDAAIDQWYKDYYASLKAQSNGNGGGSGGYESNGNFQWPVTGFSHISSYYGEVVDRSKPHSGVDIAGAGIYGQPIVAADSGRVIQVTSGWGGGYGNSVYIDHGNGYSTRYGHCCKLNVITGQQVTKGQTIGWVGSTGDSTGPHLHFEIRVNGVTRNPLSYFKR